MYQLLHDQLCFILLSQNGLEEGFCVSLEYFVAAIMTTPEDVCLVFFSECKQWTPERLIDWGARIGVACTATVQKMLERQPHAEHAYRACLGLLSLSKRYGEARLEAACTLALARG